MIPRQRYICGNLWKIRQKKGLIYKEKPVFGLCDPIERLILIESTLSKKYKEQCLFHEICHAVLFEMEAKLSFSENERVVESLEIQLFNLFKIVPK